MCFRPAPPGRRANKQQTNNANLPKQIHGVRDSRLATRPLPGRLQMQLRKFDLMLPRFMSRLKYINLRRYPRPRQRMRTRLLLFAPFYSPFHNIEYARTAQSAASDLLDWRVFVP